MIRPDAIPVRIAPSRVVLSPTDVHALFGKNYRLRGSERVFASRSSRAEVSVAVEEGSALRLVLDALDRNALGTGPPIRLSGPAASVAAPEPESIGRTLALPEGLIRAWGLHPDQAVTIRAGTVAFGDVRVRIGTGEVVLGRADALAAGLADGSTVRWDRDLTLVSETVVPEPDASLRATGRLITENDVRQARLHGQKIHVRPEHILTPAARTLGHELGVFGEG